MKKGVTFHTHANHTAVVNLIQKLEAEGMSAEKIIESIKYVETAESKAEAK